MPETTIEIPTGRLVRVADGIDVPRSDYAIKGDVLLYSDGALLGSITGKRIKRLSAERVTLSLSGERVPAVETVEITYEPRVS